MPDPTSTCCPPVKSCILWLPSLSSSMQKNTAKDIIWDTLRTLNGKTAEYVNKSARATAEYLSNSARATA
jgi:hypothetical protein